MQRRKFLKLAALSAATTAQRHSLAMMLGAQATPRPNFNGVSGWQPVWDAALTALAGNIATVPHFGSPVLLEGAVYAGIWQECGPLEGLVYAGLRQYVPALEHAPAPLRIARANHMAFFALQREDGQLPADVKKEEVGFGQIQMVVPIAATAWELAQASGDEALLTMAYHACGRWDAWLRKYRNTRGTGLVEGFCTYDTGMDHSSRWAGIPNACPEGNAKLCPPLASLPRLCPDLSATAYGGRVALAAMARALGRQNEADRWEQDAETIRQLIIARLYSPEDASFYDLDAQNHFVKVRSVVLTRVLGEHVLKLEIASDRAIFDSIWSRQLHNADAFWVPYPFPSVALNDPLFVRPIPRNSWGGASQALTALRAPRWMEHYGKGADLNLLMRQWVSAIVHSGSFHQQMDPVTGAFTMADPGGYSPAALVYLDFVRRLSAA